MNLTDLRTLYRDRGHTDLPLSPERLITSALAFLVDSCEAAVPPKDPDELANYIRDVLKELDDANETIDAGPDAEEDLGIVLDETDKEQAKLTELHATLAALTKQCDTRRTELAKLRAEYIDLQKTVTLLRTTRDALQADVKLLRSEVSRAKPYDYPLVLALVQAVEKSGRVSPSLTELVAKVRKELLENEPFPKDYRT